MILTPIILEDIQHIQKANKSHERAFESIIDKVYREDKERKEKAENDRKKKEAILHKQRLEKRKAEEAKRAKAKERHDAEDRARRGAEQRATAEELPSGNNESVREGVANDARLESGIDKREANDTNGISSRSVSGGLGSTWSEVSPEQASQYMAQGTGVSADVWAGVIYRESSNNPTIVNEIGCFGYLQLHPVHGASSTWTPQQYLDKAIEIYNTAGAGSWEAW